MLSATANLLLSLRATLAALADPDGKKYFSFVDQDTGQLDQTGASNRYPVTFPCILIDFEDIQYTSASAGIQTGKCVVSLKIGFPPFSASATGVPGEYPQKAVYYYDLEQLVYQTLQDKAPILAGDDGADLLANIYGNFNRISASTLKRRDALRVRMLRFAIAYDDYSAQPGYQLHPAVVDIATTLQF